MTRYTVTTCPGCGRRMAVNGRTTCARLAVRAKRGPARPYDGPYVSPLRASRSVADHSPDSALGVRERGVPGRRSSKAPDARPIGSPEPTSRRRPVAPLRGAGGCITSRNAG